MREVGDGADMRAQAISGREKGEGVAAVASSPEWAGALLGCAMLAVAVSKGESRAGLAGLAQRSWVSRPEWGRVGEKRRKHFSFYFFRVLTNHFQIDFLSNSNLIKTNHYKNKGAAACMHQEGSNLIFDFF